MNRARRIRLVLSLALTVLTVTPPASARAGQAAETPACASPELRWDYDPAAFTARATLPVSGCPAREGRRFPLWLSITRYEDTTTRGAAREVLCGPFPSAADSDGHRSCDVNLSFNHPEAERAAYEVQVAYPGADGPETTYLEVACVSDGAGAGCEPEGDRP